MQVGAATIAVWSIAALATAGVVARPFRLPEAVWAASGAALLVVFGLVPWRDALAAVNRGDDVYLFLAGMMLLSEVARREGVFDWIAAHTVRAASGSSPKLFLLVYGAGVGVTAILSNDATAVVLTPAVFAAATKAKVDPLPFLFICALVANAASFVLPISNPANLVVFDDHLPSLLPWLTRFLLPSAAAIAATCALQFLAERKQIGTRCAIIAEPPPLSAGGRTALAAIAATVVALLVFSGLDRRLGPPTAALGAVSALVVFVSRRESPWPTLRKISWSILPLVAGLFVLVEGLDRTSVIATMSEWLSRGAATSTAATAAAAGAAIGIASNLLNNLPAGLIATSALAHARVLPCLTDAVLIGVDLGPNLSITGSLATILWLAVIRREGEDVTFARFLRTGAIVMPPALAVALGARLLLG